MNVFHVFMFIQIEFIQFILVYSVKHKIAPLLLCLMKTVVFQILFQIRSCDYMQSLCELH